LLQRRLKKPKSASANSTISFEIFPSAIKSPARIKKGTAIKGKESKPANIRCGTITKGIFPIISIKIEDNPIEIATGIPNNISNINERNRIKAIIIFLPP
jgi:hypothetical protein